MKIFAIIAVLCCLSSCSYDKALTPDQKQQVEALDNQIIADKAQAKQLESDAALVLEKASHEMDQQALQQMQISISKMRDDYAALTAKIAAETAQRNQTLAAAVHQNTGGVIDWAMSLIPGVPEPLKQALIAAGIPLLFQRPRDHAKDALGQLAKLNVGGALKSTATAVGLLHTEDKTTPTATKAA